MNLARQSRGTLHLNTAITRDRYDSYGLPGDHAQVTEHGEHGGGGVTHRDYTRVETKLVEV